jgi:hypothetical protein
MKKKNQWLMVNDECLPRCMRELIRQSSIVNREWLALSLFKKLLLSLTSYFLPLTSYLLPLTSYFLFHKSFKKLFLLLTSYLLILTSSAQSVSASLDRDKILLGEQVTLQLNLTNVNATSVVTWPQINDTANHLEIVHRTSIDTIVVNRSNSYQQNFTVTGFDSGRWQLGPFDFLIRDTSGKQIKISSPAVYLTVLPVDVSSMKNYHPLKDIIDVETSFNWLPVIIIAAIIIVAVIIFLIIKNRKKKMVQPLKPVLQGTPLERAMEKLQLLQNQSLTGNEETKKFHSAIDIICREYFEEITSIKAMQATTSEIFSRMSVYLQDAQLRRKFRDIFDLNASVKFAKYFPAEAESKSMLNDVIASLQKIDALIQQAKSNAYKMVSKY